MLDSPPDPLYLTTSAYLLWFTFRPQSTTPIFFWSKMTGYQLVDLRHCHALSIPSLSDILRKKKMSRNWYGTSVLADQSTLSNSTSETYKNYEYNSACLEAIFNFREYCNQSAGRWWCAHLARGGHALLLISSVRRRLSISSIDFRPATLLTK